MTFEIDGVSLRCLGKPDSRRSLLASVSEQLFVRIRDVQSDAKMVYGPDRQGDDHPAARRLGALTDSWDWVAVTWRAWSLVGGASRSGSPRLADPRGGGALPPQRRRPNAAGGDRTG